MRPVTVSCKDHESGGPVLIQQWDGKQWKIISDWIEPMTDVIRPMIEESAAKYAKENKIDVRTCE
jgi:branched-chain amino acid transport system substrate-binding protein